MATFYFNGAADLAAALPTDWQTLGNWWMNDTFTTPATSLPTSMDDVIAVASISTNSGSEPTVANFTMYEPSLAAQVYLQITLTVTGTAAFYDTAGNASALTGNCVFHDRASAAGAINGHCTFYDTATAYGYNFVITGNCTVNDFATIQAGTVVGSIAFNDYASLVGDITVQNGICTFNDSAFCDNYPSITGDVRFNDTATTRRIYGLDYGVSPPRLSPATWILPGYGARITGTCTYSLSAATWNLKAGGLMPQSPEDGYSLVTVSIDYEKGINGSSILGIV